MSKRTVHFLVDDSQFLGIQHCEILELLLLKHHILSSLFFQLDFLHCILFYSPQLLIANFCTFPTIVLMIVIKQ